MTLWFFMGLIILVTILLPYGEEEATVSNIQHSAMSDRQKMNIVQRVREQHGGAHGCPPPPMGCGGEEYRHRLSLFSEQPCRQPSCLRCGYECAKMPCGRTNCTLTSSA